MRSAERRPLMMLNAIVLAVCAALLVYLIYALLHPEKF
jgi:K+-transporting ATPase KdpF subunit